jgi:hypothetical protein
MRNVGVKKGKRGEGGGRKDGRKEGRKGIWHLVFLHVDVQIVFGFGFVLLGTSDLATAHILHLLQGGGPVQGLLRSGALPSRAHGVRFESPGKESEATEGQTRKEELHTGGERGRCERKNKMGRTRRVNDVSGEGRGEGGERRETWKEGRRERR